MDLTADEGTRTDFPFRQLAQHLPTPCWISDAEGVITWVNDAWIAYTGKAVEALAGDGLRQLHDPQVYPRVREKWIASRSAGLAAEMVFPLRGRDGILRPFHTRVVPLRDAAGRITSWFGTNTDISAQADAEARAAQSREILRENEARLRLATEAAGVGVWEWRIDTNEMVYSPQARAICGFPEHTPITYEMVVGVTHPDDLPHTSAQATRALDPLVRDRSPYEYRIVRADGEVRWVTALGEAVFEPGPEGVLAATRYVGVLIDITQRRQAEEAIRASERRLQMALRAGRMAAWAVDASGALEPNPEMNVLIGLAPDSRPQLEALIPNYLPGELDRIRDAAEGARRRGDRHFEVEYQYRRADGEVRWYHARAEAQVGAEGMDDGVLGVVMDVTERKADEERLRFLAREVDHRANNLLTIVQSAIALSHADGVEELRQVITGRVHALARAHQLLSEARWTGAELRRLVEEEFLAYRVEADPGRLTVEGPAVELQPAAAQGVAMVIHELATNAVKHGALSRPGGRVRLSWSVDGGRLVLRWQETGGPAVTPPRHRGFGTSVIDRALRGALGGRAIPDWRPEGLVCELELPADRALTAGPSAGG